MRSRVPLILGFFLFVHAAEALARPAAPAGLTRDDWTQIRRSIGLASSPEAMLLGQADPFGQPGARFGQAVAVSGDTVLVGAWRHHGDPRRGVRRARGEGGCAGGVHGLQLRYAARSPSPLTRASPSNDL